MSSDADGDGGYVHRPADYRDDREGATGAGAEADANAGAGGDSSGEFGRSGWALVTAVVLSVLVVPGIIYLYPAGPGNLGLTFFAAMLALPFLPALLLGLTAVWSMTAAAGADAE